MSIRQPRYHRLHPTLEKQAMTTWYAAVRIAKHAAKNYLTMDKPQSPSMRPKVRIVRSVLLLELSHVKCVASTRLQAVFGGRNCQIACKRNCIVKPASQRQTTHKICTKKSTSPPLDTSIARCASKKKCAWTFGRWTWCTRTDPISDVRRANLFRPVTAEESTCCAGFVEK